MTENDTEAQFESQFEHGISLRDSGDIEGAIHAFVPLKKSSIKSAALHAVLGGLYMDLQQFESGLEEFREAVRIVPKNEVASLGVFHCLWNLDRHLEALDEMKRFIAAGGTCEDYSDWIEKFKLEDDDNVN